MPPRFVTFIKTLQPNLGDYTPQKQVTIIWRFLVFLSLLPVSIIGGLGLLLITPYQDFLQFWWVLLLLTALGYIFYRYPLTFNFKWGENSILSMRLTLWWLVLWSTLWIIGPIALWGALFWVLPAFKLLPSANFSLTMHHFRRWGFAFNQQVAAIIFPNVIGIIIYQTLGGTFPLLNWTKHTVFTAAIATTASALTLCTLFYVLLLIVSRITITIPKQKFFPHSIPIVLFAYTIPFFGASAFTTGGWPAFIAFLMTLTIFHLLLYYGQSSIQEHQYKTQQASLLEDMAIHLMSVPIDKTDLPATLNHYIPLIFEGSPVEIYLFPDERLYPRPQAKHALPLLANDSIWRRLQASDAPFLLIPQVIPVSPNQTALHAIVHPITNHKKERIGGIFLVKSPQLPEAASWLPALRSISTQITSSLHRMKSHEESLAHQAKLYQEELYQSYEAEAEAQRVAYKQIARELALAGKIQATFLPSEAPDIPGWQLTATYRPARQVSGDFYDFIHFPDGKLGIVMADVAGKGMGAALYMALAKTLIRTYALSYPDQPAKVLSLANERMLYDTQDDWFVTVFYGILDLQTGEMFYGNAGHNPPFLWVEQQDKTDILALTNTGIPLGVLDDMPWTERKVHFPPKSICVLYTDGIPEAQNDADELFGETKLQEIITTNQYRSVDILEIKLIKAIQSFVGNAPQFDDIALLIIKREK